MSQPGPTCHPRMQVLRHPLTQAYLVLSGLSGLALTYYYNNTGGWREGCLSEVLVPLPAQKRPLLPRHSPIHSHRGATKH